ncbi:DUF397 domain-containing protein [Nocardia brasiliensis]|uniref:DUF397 domain-containing protein n=1 Tax=Nocardia brasiliensis TaxID=37326 RepID=UPI00366C8B42
MKTDRSTAIWFKSSYRRPGQDCVEVAVLGGDLVGVRDSKVAYGAAVVFSPSERDAFTDGEFDRSRG